MNIVSVNFSSASSRLNPSERMHMKNMNTPCKTAEHSSEPKAFRCMKIESIIEEWKLHSMRMFRNDYDHVCIIFVRVPLKLFSCPPRPHASVFALHLNFPQSNYISKLDSIVLTLSTRPLTYRHIEQTRRLCSTKLADLPAIRNMRPFHWISDRQSATDIHLISR